MPLFTMLLCKIASAVIRIYVTYQRWLNALSNVEVTGAARLYRAASGKPQGYNVKVRGCVKCVIFLIRFMNASPQ